MSYCSECAKSEKRIERLEQALRTFLSRHIPNCVCEFCKLAKMAEHVRPLEEVLEERREGTVL